MGFHLCSPELEIMPSAGDRADTFPVTQTRELFYARQISKSERYNSEYRWDRG